MKSEKAENRAENSRQPSFGAFVITYERPVILTNTVRRLRDQTLPPALILIIDNSESDDTARAVEEMAGPDLEYFRVGYNSGPAGAAQRGLKILAEKGFDWIYWGDDDNPPANKNLFRDFFRRIRELENKKIPVGLFGGRGGNLNRFTGRIRSLSNKELKKAAVMPVDSIPGGHTMLVNAKVVQEGILPSEEIFFGFEELDFCLEIRKRGFTALVDTEHWFADNLSEGHRSMDYRWKGSSFGDPDLVMRDYYSTRNLLYIFSRNAYFLPFAVILSKSIIKSYAGFRHGWNYGKKNFKMQWLAIIHFCRGKYGRFGKG